MLALGLALGLAVAAADAGKPPLRVSPVQVVLDVPESTQQLLITGHDDSRRPVDRTRSAAVRVVDPRFVAVDRAGVIHPLDEGQTEILIETDGMSLRVPVEVRGLRRPAPVSFEHEIIPILTKARCNSGGCHGKAEGQNGFKLSVFGFDPPADFAALTRESRGRRVFVGDAKNSPLLLKASAAVPHGGGRKMAAESLSYRRIVRWIAEGARFEPSMSPIATLRIEPQERLMWEGEAQQLQVTAIDRNGRERCVTAEAEYESNADSIAQVSPLGLIESGDVPGEAAILVRYLGKVAVCRVTHPQRGVSFARPPEANFIDRHVWNKLERLGIPPGDIADDATFLRRVFLDTIGTLPTPAEARAFLAEKGAEKRSRLVDRLLMRAEYADYWALRWADLLRVDQDRLQPQGAVAMTRWLRQQFADNRPYDEFAREILTARGNVHETGPAAIFKVFDTPEVASRSFSQLFLGVRIECAQCHQHPFERWGQEDYFGLAGFFTGVSLKSLPGGSPAVSLKPGSDHKHPRTDAAVPARALGAAPVDLSQVADRREPLADWMTAPDNPYFATTIANRIWAHYLGRGLVEPIDDIRPTNPATNPPLLDALTQHLRGLRYDLRAFTKTLLLSRTYQLTALPIAGNSSDAQNFSHAHEKSLPAEVLLDAICQATGVTEKFPGWPAGYRAIHIWDNRLPSYFFRIFGRPLRVSVCECERSNEPSISQALHLMNSPEILGKIQASDGRARKLADSSGTPEEIVDELYLATLARFPTAAERTAALGEFSAADRRIVAEDLLWALLNSKEFLYNH